MNVTTGSGSNTENPAGSPKVTPSTPDDGFGNFEKLARKLLRVPKSDLDKKLRKHQRS